MSLKELGFKEIDHTRLKALNKPYKIYAELLDDSTLAQFEDVLAEPYVTKAALMPDAHAGYSMPIGAVCSTKDVVVPQFVGFDIGCGMCAYKSDFTKDEIKEKAQEIYDGILKVVPVGFSRHDKHQSLKIDLPLSDYADMVLQSSGLMQVGTLGGGNHFIEIGYGADEKVWIVIHSGSRGFGHKIASHYMLQAYLEKNPSEGKLEKIVKEWEERNVRFKEAKPEVYEKTLAKYKLKQQANIAKSMKLDNIKGIYGLDVNSKLGEDYIKDQNFALAYAVENRKRMIERIHEVLNSTIGATYAFDPEDEMRFINKNHNHADYHDESGEWIHRKGATQAEKGMRGVIPGNMRDGSFVVIGKGNADSLNSSSHGAGRVMSRNKAKAAISLEAFEETMKGITGTIGENTIDESPFAYKDIFEVMKLQEDLVEIEEYIKPLINVKDSPKGYGRRNKK